MNTEPKKTKLERMKVKLKTEPITPDKDKLLRALENLEMATIETEKGARTDVDKCEPSKLFNLIARASSYRMMAACAEDSYPEDLDIKEHVKSSKDILIGKTLELTSVFENECRCKKI